jgi:hypothetical protein
VVRFAQILKILFKLTLVIWRNMVYTLANKVVGSILNTFTPLERLQDKAAPPGGMNASWLRGEEIEISCTNGADLRDNGFNIGGLAIWDGIGRMDRKHQFEADPSQQSEDRDISLFRGIQIGLIRIAHKA